MSKSTKIMVSVISAVVAVCIVITTVVSVSKNKNNSPADATTVSSTVSGQTDVSETSAQAASTTENAADLLKSQIIGKWMDSAGMSGYEFFENGSANVTYVNLTVPVINMPINGTAKGSYTLDGDTLTVEFSIYKKTITDKFTASVENNTLTLVNKDDGEKSTYQRQTEEPASTDSSGITLPAEETDSIFGAWTDSGKTKKLLFREDGTMKVTTNSAEYDGVFLIEDDDITIQYAVGNGTLTEEYTFKISGNSMSFKDDKGQTILFVRDSGQSSSDLGLVGKWMDSSDMSGYTFKADGTVEITYVNFTVPVINMPINGKFGGTYAVDGDRITIRSSIYSRTVTNEYTFKINGNNLTLTSVEDGAV
ncbi:MAG: DUF5640 domain-containing protein, partial [Acutalibacteraceae bacterium]